MRIKKIFYLAAILLFLLVIRVFFISVISGEKYAKSATAQRTKIINLSEKRGVIYDRNMIPLTDNTKKQYAVKIDSSDKVKISELDSLQNVSFDKVILLNKRYPVDSFLSHIIGYTTDDGGYGVEAVFNDLLKTDLSSGIKLVKDATDNVIEGFGISSTDKLIRSGVILSIDYHIQEIVEKAADTSEVPCAVVVAEVKTGDIVALASRPNFNAEKIADSLEKNNGELINRALSAYDAGSVFKVVVAAAALEEGIANINSSFECSGEIKLNNNIYYCHKRDGHGKISLSEGIAYSCNCVFYKLGEELGAEKILYYARRFGFGTKILKAKDFYESDGLLPPFNLSLGDVYNLSIGQGELLVTPLQAADMMCTIVNGGVRKLLRISCGVAADDGIPVYTEPVETGRVISESTAYDLRHALTDAVRFGTGSGADIPFGAGGKTGSAESGWLNNGEQMVHGWFVGFFPAENPEYICSVLCENGKSGSSSAVPVFTKIAQSDYFLGKFSKNY